MSLYLAAGLVTEATAVGGELLHRFPDDQPSAEAVMHVLAHRLDTIDGEFVVLNDGADRGMRHPHSPPEMLARLRNQRRVIGALIIRETRTRFADAKLGYGWALIEPILHITLLSVTFAVLMHGQPPIGTHFFIFYYTGLIPYHIFVHTSSGMSHAITGNGPVLQLPPVTTFDVIAARGLLEIMTDVIVAVILLIGFGAVGLAAAPDDLWGSVDRAPGHRRVRLWLWLRQRRPHRVLSVVGQNLRPGDAHPVFHLRYLLRAGNDAGLGARHPRLEPASACDRLVPRRLFRELSAALA